MTFTDRQEGSLVSSIVHDCCGPPKSRFYGQIEMIMNVIVHDTDKVKVKVNVDLYSASS